MVVGADEGGVSARVGDVTGITEKSHWFKILAGTPMLLARDCSQSLVRRYYLGESSLPYIPFSGWVIILLNGLEYYCLHTLVPPKTTSGCSRVSPGPCIP